MQIAGACGAGTALDVGCGAGALVRELSKLGANAWGLDISARALRAADGGLPGRFVAADMRVAPFDDCSFDVVVAMHCVEWLAECDVPVALAEVFRLSRRYACFWIATDATAMSGPGGTVRPREWWEQRLREQGFRRHSTHLLPFASRTNAVEAEPIAIMVERTEVMSDRNFSRAGPRADPTAGPALLAKRDETIRSLRAEIGRLADLVAAKEASFAMVSNEVRALEEALKVQRSTRWAVLGDMLRQRPLGLRGLLRATAFGHVILRERWRNRNAGLPHPRETVAAAAEEQEDTAARPGIYAPYVVRMPQPAPGRRPHVVHVLANFMTGGSSRLVIDLIENMGNRYEQSVLTSFAPVPPAYVGPQVTVLAGDAPAHAFRGHFARNKPDLVHVHYWGEGDEPWYRRAFNGVDALECPVIENVNTPVAPLRSPRVARYVYVSDYVQRKFGEPAAPEEVIYPGSDLGLFASGDGLRQDGNTIGMVYRLERDKLDENAIDPFILAVQRRLGTRAIIVGGGSLLRGFQRRVQAAGLQDRFQFTDYVAYVDLPALYASMAVFVAPVWKESFGQVSVFAMGAGVPVVGYATGAIPEIVADPDLVAPFADSGALADIIVRLLDDPGARARIGARNRERACAHYTVQAMVERYTRLYDSLVGRST